MRQLLSYGELANSTQKVYALYVCSPLSTICPHTHIWTHISDVDCLGIMLHTTVSNEAFSKLYVSRMSCLVFGQACVKLSG